MLGIPLWVAIVVAALTIFGWLFLKAREMDRIRTYQQKGRWQ